MQMPSAAVMDLLRVGRVRPPVRVLFEAYREGGILEAYRISDTFGPTV